MPMTVTGMDTLVAGFKKMDEQLEKKCIRAVRAGGQYVANCLQENAPVYDGPAKKGTTPGALRDSIKVTKVGWSASDGYYAKVEPVGNMPGTDESLAKIGNILEYGRSDTPPRPWFFSTLQKIYRDTEGVMKDAFEAD